MNLFFTDLDNTLIYSHRHPHNEDIKWVEILNDSFQSFMTSSTYDYLCKQKCFSIIPVTTRSFDQYIRLRQLAEDMCWKDALICNGSILLRNNEEVSEWSQESIMLCEAAAPFFERAYSVCREIFGENSIFHTEHFLFYVKTSNVEHDFLELQKLINRKHLTVLKDPRKIYIFPKVLNKGTAVNRYLKLVKEDWCMAAGDSEFDVPMLNLAGYAFASNKIAPLIKNKNIIVIDEEQMADGICDGLQMFMSQGKK